MQKASILFALLITLCLTGCSNAVKISGTVKLPDGKPLTDATLTFENEKMSVFSSLDAAGKFELYQVKPGDGVPPGTYRGQIGYNTDSLDPGLAADRDAAIAQKIPFAMKYLSADTSGLTLTVEAGKPQVLDLTLEK